MAALIVLAGALINEKVKEKRDMKRRKVLDDERRRRQLTAEINRREKNLVVERNYDSEDEREGEALPRYEDVIDNREGGSSNTSSSGGASGVQDYSEAPPPAYGRRSVEQRRHSGV